MDNPRWRPETQRALAAALLEELDEALRAERVELAARLAGPAEGAAKRSQDPQILSLAQAKLKVVRDLETALAAILPAFKILAEKPDDPEACLTAGRFYCFTKGDWDRGLPLLAKGGDPALKALAARELSRPDGASDQFALANAWWDQAETEKRSALAESRLRDHAAFGY